MKPQPRYTPMAIAAFPSRKGERGGGGRRKEGELERRGRETSVYISP